MANAKNRKCNNCPTLIWDTPKAKSTGLCKPCWAKQNIAGKPKPESMKEKLRGWRTDKPAYGTIHNRIRQMFGVPNECESCKTRTGKFQWANLSGQYLLERSDWKRLCISCHHRLDNKIWNIKRMRGF